MKNKILIIEDDITINKLLHNIVESNGYVAESAYDGEEGYRLAAQNDYGLILMDLMLPTMPGEEIIQKIRTIKNTPVIILSAKNETHNKIELLKSGADDYITKPFDIDEVLLRIQAVLRRTNTADRCNLSYKELRIDQNLKKIYVNEHELDCTAMEYSILELLLTNSNKIFSKRNLFESVTGDHYFSNENTMNVHISNLRRKIAEHTDTKYIETVYGMGYRLFS